MLAGSSFKLLALEVKLPATRWHAEATCTQAVPVAADEQQVFVAPFAFDTGIMISRYLCGHQDYCQLLDPRLRPWLGEVLQPRGLLHA